SNFRGKLATNHWKTRQSKVKSLMTGLSEDPQSQVMTAILGKRNQASPGPVPGSGETVLHFEMNCLAKLKFSYMVSGSPESEESFKATQGLEVTTPSFPVYSQLKGN
ncbi:hypothetical protein STEG23_028259, partial [Scotinomys teguina]